MAETHGTVTNWSDLLTALHAFITGTPATPGCDWTEAMVKRDCINPTASGCKEVVYQNTGLSDDTTITIGIREYSGSLRQGWTLNVYPVWLTGQDWNGNSSSTLFDVYSTTYNGYMEHPCVPLLPDNMSYWFTSNKQRIMGIIKTGSTYQTFYLGFGIPMGPPTAYPMPLAAIGSGYNCIDVTDVTDVHRFSIAPWLARTDYYSTNYRFGAMIVTPSSTFVNAMSMYDKVRFLPFPTGAYGSNEMETEDLNADNMIWASGRDIRGQWQIMPVYIVTVTLGALMSLDGMCALPSYGLQAEDELNIDGTLWLAIHNIHRTSTKDWMAFCTDQTITWTTTSTSTTTTTTTTTAA